jgi:DNA-damage-inducible protein D
MHTTKIAIFQKKEVRKTLHNNEWRFSVSDVIEALTDTVDVRDYIKKMRKRDDELNSYWGTNCPLLEMTAKDGKKRKITSANTEGIFRIIQSIPSPISSHYRSFVCLHKRQQK